VLKKVVEIRINHSQVFSATTRASDELLQLARFPESTVALRRSHFILHH
jgi:hypothetical protein